MSALSIVLLWLIALLIIALPFIYWYSNSPRFWGPRARRKWEDEGE